MQPLVQHPYLGLSAEERAGLGLSERLEPGVWCLGRIPIARRLSRTLKADLPKSAREKEHDQACDYWQRPVLDEM